MIIANQWYNIAKTSTLGSTTGIRIEFGSYYALVRTAVDYGNIVITAVESNIREEKIKVGVRIRYNRGWFADVRISPTIDDADLKASVYENNGWTAVSPNTSTAGSTVCIINDVISQMLPSSGGESLWERVNVGTEEEPKYALVPKEYDGFKPGIVTHTFVTFGGMGSGATGEGGTGNGAVILDGLEDVQIINPTPGQVLTYDETTGLWINKSTDFVTQQYVDNAVTNLSGNINTLQDNINTLQGYFTNGSANNALMLGGQLPEYYATATGLTALSDRVAELEKYFYFDKERNAVCVKEDYNFIVPKYITFGGLDTGSGEGGGGLSRVTIYLGETPYTSETGVVRLPAYPVIPTDISAFNNDKAYATVTEVNNAISTAVTPLSGNINTLQGSINTLQGYFTDGSANNALKLGGQLPEYYATKSALTAVSDRVTELEKLFYYDAEHDAVRTSLSLIVDQWLTFGGAAMGSGSVTGSTTLAGLNDVQITDLADGQSLVYDSTLNKWVNKAVSGGTAGSVAWDAITGKPELIYYNSGIDANTLSTSYNKMGYGYATNGWRESGPAISFGVTNYQLQMQMSLASEASAVYWRPIINASKYTWRKFLDTYNYSSYALPITGGTINGTTETPLIVNTTNSTSAYIRIDINNSGKAAFGWNSDNGAFIYNWQGGDYLKVGDDHHPYFNDKVLLHSGNYSSHALPLSGGTMAAYSSIYLNGSSSNRLTGLILDSSYQEFVHANSYGYISFGPFNELFAHIYTDKDYFYFNKNILINGNSVITTANIGSQSVDYANSAGKISNHTISDLAVYSAAISTNGSNRHIGYGYATGGWLASGPAMVFGTTNGYRLFLQAYAGSHRLFINYSSGDTTKVTGSWRELAYLDSVLSLSGGTMNGTITTDATPGMILRRTNPSVPYIRFTDTANTAYGEIGVRIEGHPCFYPTIRANNGETTASWKNIYYEGADITNAAGGVYIHRTNEINSFNGGLYLNHRGDGSDSNGTTGNIVMCSNGGNVLVGLTNESGYRFQVSGVARFGGVTTSSLLVGYDSNCIEGVSPDGNITGNVWINSVSTGRTVMNVGGGNALIGTSTDAGYKLSVNGTILSPSVRVGELRLGGTGLNNNITTGKWYSAKIGYVYESASPDYLKPAITFSTMYNSYAEGSEVERMRICADGNVSIGYAGNAGVKLYVAGNFVATGSVTFNLASDRRLKSNIKPLTYRNTMRVLHRLRPVSFEWNETAVELDSSRQGLCDGFIADEYEGLIPNSGRDIWEKYRAIDYTRAIPYLAKGWQIHESELDKMRRKVKTMERRIKHLENLLVEHNITAA